MGIKIEALIRIPGKMCRNLKTGTFVLDGTLTTGFFSVNRFDPRFFSEPVDRLIDFSMPHSVQSESRGSRKKTAAIQPGRIAAAEDLRQSLGGVSNFAGTGYGRSV